MPTRIVNHAVECRHCLEHACPQEHHACLHAVEAGRVVGAALELLAEGTRSPARQEKTAYEPRS